MLDPLTYVKILLKNRKLSQNRLIALMEEKGIKGVHPEHLSVMLNTQLTSLWARRIEIALDLPRFSLVQMTKMSNGDIYRINKMEEELGITTK